MIDLLFTRKMAADLKLEPNKRLNPSDPDPKYSWLGHLLTVNRHKFYIFINNASLYSVLLEKKRVKNPLQDFKARVGLWMKKLNVNPEKAEEYLKHFEHINIYRASDKRILGHLNNIRLYAEDDINNAFFLKELPPDVALENCEIKINDVPHERLKTKFPDPEFERMINGDGYVV